MLVHNNIFPDIAQDNIFVSETILKSKRIVLPLNGDNFVEISVLEFYNRFKIKCL